MTTFTLPVRDEIIQDARNIARGLYAPLTGFLRQADFEGVVANMRLASGAIWPIPIVLDISGQQKAALGSQKQIVLTDGEGRAVAMLQDLEVFEYDKRSLARDVFGTEDVTHPGVAEIMQMQDYLVGGDIQLLDEGGDCFTDLIMEPSQTKALFAGRGWKTVVAFQTRNVPHRGHEYLQKQALRHADGLFVHPVVGKKKIGDFKDEIMLASYEVLIDKYYPKDRVVLGALPIRMRYAGPREAVMHALIRRNFGCTHFIVGRDHAGVGNFYPPFAAQEIFQQFSAGEIGIKILKFPEVIYCEGCQDHRFITDCRHESKISFSGSLMRSLIQDKRQPPHYLIRPEVYYLLLNDANPLIDAMYQRERKHKGFVLWFTGLSQAGKSTTADRVFEALQSEGYKVERLDGDIVRKSLTADLGFSKTDRDENIARVGQIAKLLSRRGVIVLASFISPYRRERELLRNQIDNFIEVFVDAPLSVCEARDTKGLYQKARQRLIKNFTGISDPYEQPENPQLMIRTDEFSIEECANQVVDYLKHAKLLS